MKREVRLKAKGLSCTPLTDEQLETLIASEGDEHRSGDLSVILQHCKEQPENRLWHTLWTAGRDDGRVIGSLHFQGPPVNGEVRLSFTISEEFRDWDESAEAVTSAVNWAFSNEKVYFVTAVTEPGDDSAQSLLLKAGFTLAEGDPEGAYYEMEKQATSWMSIYMCLGLGVGISLGTALGSSTMGLTLGLCFGLLLGVLLDGQDQAVRDRLRAARGKPKKGKGK